MNKRYANLWLIAAMLGIMCPAFSQKYSIQLCAFTEKIEPAFFDFAGFQNVQHQTNTPNFHQYFWGDFSTSESAIQQLLILKRNPLLKDLGNLKIVYGDETNFNQPLTILDQKEDNQFTDFQLFSRSLEFSNPKISLQKTDVAILEEVMTILLLHPELKIRIIAEQKKDIAKETLPNEVVENFLLANQIPAYRIKTIYRTYTPLATNTTTVNKQQVIMTLVDLKEEIVLDKFGTKGMMVTGPNGQTTDILE